MTLHILSSNRKTERYKLEEELKRRESCGKSHNKLHAIDPLFSNARTLALAAQASLKSCAVKKTIVCPSLF